MQKATRPKGRRAGFWLLLAAVAAAAAIAALALLPVMRNILDSGNEPKGSAVPEEKTAAASAAADGSGSASTEPAAPEEAAAPAASSAEPVQNTKWYQELGVTYLAGSLRVSAAADESCASFTPSGGGSTPRLDLRRVSFDTASLTQESFDRIAAGLLQAYYFDPPATQDIRVTDSQLTPELYTASAHADASSDTPAMTAEIKIFRLEKAAWYAVLLLPENTAEQETAAPQAAFDSLELR